MIRRSGHNFLTFFLTVCTVFTATAGSAAEGKVRDSEEPGSLLFHLCRCHGIQGRKACKHTHTQAICCQVLQRVNSNPSSTGPRV